VSVYLSGERLVNWLASRPTRHSAQQAEAIARLVEQLREPRSASASVSRA